MEQLRYMLDAFTRATYDPTLAAVMFDDASTAFFNIIYGEFNYSEDERDELASKIVAAVRARYI